MIRPDLPVVISSGFITEELRAAAQRLGVRAMVQKEHTIEELGTVIHSILRTVDGGTATQPVRRD
jgi:DNA-binding NarL/FixJ family response regulator